METEKRKLFLLMNKKSVYRNLEKTFVSVVALHSYKRIGFNISKLRALSILGNLCTAWWLFHYFLYKHKIS